MYKRILVATDGSELAQKAVKSGAVLAKNLGSNLTIVTVTEKWPLVEAAAQAELGIDDPAGQYERIARAQGERILAAAEQIVSEFGLTCERVHVKNTEPATGVIETALKANADLIVVASHGRRGLSRMLLGSVANEILIRSTVPVMVCR